MRYVTLIIFILITFSTTNALATTYYVKTNGNNSADGKSHATAWRTIAKVNSFSFKNGDDVYFLEGNTWSNTVLKIDWDGTSSNRVVIGSYYMANGFETIRIPSKANKPVISGTYNQKGKLIDDASAVPRTQHGGLVSIDGDYVTVQNISIKFSAGEGLDVVNLKNGRADHHHAIIENIEVYYTAAACTTLERRTHHNIVRNNEFHGCDWGWKNKDMITTGWPGCNGASKSNYNLYENNFIHECFGEGIALLSSDYNIVRGNRLASIRSAGIYSDNSQHNVVEHNIIIGDPGGTLFFNGASPGYSGGIVIAVEDYSGARDSIYNIYRNNLMAYTKYCITIGMETNAKAAGRIAGGDFYGNTCINPHKWSVNINLPAVNVGKINIKNNIFAKPDTQEASSICRAPTDSDIVFSNNAWEFKPADNDCNGTADVYGKPTYAKSDWKNISPSNFPIADDFTLQNGSVGKKAAATLKQQVLTISDYPLHKELRHLCKDFDSNGLTFDFNCKLRTSNSDIGAIDSKAIQTPTGLMLSLTL